MNILVLNGSPKGDYSITVHTSLFLQAKFPEHSFDFLNVGQKVRSLTKDFSPAREKIEKADLLIFSYPVYTFIAPSQLHKFIELLKKENMDLGNKFATQISTSKHFYDVTAHNYIRDNCGDLGLKFIKGICADMDDLTTKRGQKEAVDFFKYVLWCCENNHYEQQAKAYSESKNVPVTVPNTVGKTKKGEVVIIADLNKEDTCLKNMIDRFRAVLPMNSRVVNIAEYPFKGGCLGCFNCAVSGKCIYKDNFDEFLRNDIQTADAMVFAFTIKDHSMGSTFKMYDDRQFCNGHRTVTMGKPVGYLVSGNYSEEFNLQMIIEGRAEVGGNFLTGVATDEFNPDEEIDKMAETLCYALKNKYQEPQNFYGVGGMKIFRDLIYTMRGMMKADHKFYKEHGQYDFPQKEKGRIAFMYLVGLFITNGKVKEKMGNKMNEGMVLPYKKVIADAKDEVFDFVAYFAKEKEEKV